MILHWFNLVTNFNIAWNRIYTLCTKIIDCLSLHISIQVLSSIYKKYEHDHEFCTKTFMKRFTDVLVEWIHYFKIYFSNRNWKYSLNENLGCLNRKDVTIFRAFLLPKASLKMQSTSIAVFKIHQALKMPVSFHKLAT